MTREEAIADIRDNIKPIVGGKSLEMAIKALEQEPWDDCISRSAVLAIAGDSCLDLDSYEDTREFCDEIKELLPVTPPHPKMGHWIGLDTGKPSHLKDGMTTEGVKCSECGEWLVASDEYACYGRYCANCGCKMQEVKNDKK